MPDSNDIIEQMIAARQAKTHEASWGRVLLVFVVCVVLAYGVYLAAVALGAPFAG